MHTNRTTAAFIFSLAIALLATSAFFFFFNIIKNKNEHTSAVLTALEDKILEKRNENAIREKISKVEQIQATINTYFVDATKIDSFVNYLESLGATAEAEVKVENVEVVATAKNTIAVRISAEGDFSEVMRTIKLVENAPYKIRIGEISLDKRTRTVTETVKDVSVMRQIPAWHADVSFTILSAS